MQSWIKMETALDDHPVVVELATRLDVDEYCIIGRLWKLWSIADTHTEEGDLPAISTAAIDRKLKLPGLCAELIDLGWMSVDDSGRVVLPNYTKHNGKNAKRRAQDSKRKREKRAAEKAAAEAQPQAIPPSPPAPRNSTDGDSTTAASIPAEEPPSQPRSREEIEAAEIEAAIAKGESNGKPTTNVKSKQFRKPTREEAEAYCNEKGLALVDLDRWFDHYTSNGWKVGRNPMKDWKATLRNWNRDQEKRDRADTQKASLQQWSKQPRDKLAGLKAAAANHELQEQARATTPVPEPDSMATVLDVHATAVNRLQPESAPEIDYFSDPENGGF